MSLFMFDKHRVQCYQIIFLYFYLNMCAAADISSPPEKGNSSGLRVIEFDELLREKCDPEEYDDSYIPCDEKGKWKSLRDRCMKTDIQDLNFERAKTHCEQSGAKLMSFKSAEDLKRSKKFVSPGKDYWIGIKKEDGRFFYIDGTGEATLDAWQDKNSGDCVYMKDSRFYTDDCLTERNIICSRPLHFGKYVIKAPVIVFVGQKPGQPHEVAMGDSFSVTCIGYAMREDEVAIKFLSKLLPADAKAAPSNYTKQSFIVSAETSQIYHYTDRKVCTRRTNFTITMRMQKMLNNSMYTCCSEKNCSEPSPPVIAVWLNKRAVLDLNHKEWAWTYGEKPLALQCDCVLYLGTRQVGSIAFISDFSCGTTLYVFDVIKSGEPQEYTTRSNACYGLWNVKMNKESIEDNGNSVHASLKIMAKGHTQRGRCICYSYDATDRYINDRLFDENDPLASFSPEINIMFKPKKPILEIHYHGQGNVVYHNHTLQITCGAAVGTNGTLEWIFENGAYKETVVLKYGERPSSIPDGWTVDYRPLNHTCPHGWISDFNSGTCLKLFDEHRAWKVARDKCLDLMSDLVTIMDEQANKAIERLLNGEAAWIGLRRADSSHQWLDGDEEATFLKLDNPKDTNQSTDSCAYFDDGKWIYENCEEELQYVCQTPKNTFPNEETYKDTAGPVINSTVSFVVLTTTPFSRISCKTGDLVVTSESWQVEYTYGDMVIEISKDSTGDIDILHVDCSAAVGDNGLISLAIFSGNETKFLYYFGSDQNVTEVKPTSSLRVVVHEGSFHPSYGPILTIKVDIEACEDVDGTYPKCFPYKVDEDYVYFGERGEALSKSVQSEMSQTGAPSRKWIIPAVIAACVASGALMYVLLTPKYPPSVPGTGSGTPTTKDQGGEEGIAPKKERSDEAQKKESSGELESGGGGKSDDGVTEKDASDDE